jgi:hypothetical protein
MGAWVEQRVEVVMNTEKTARIRELNDALRQSGRGGRIVMTSGVQALGEGEQATLFHKIASYDDFTPNNDPHGEHDFGVVEVAGQKFFWKIDYYDRAMEAGSEDPSDPAQTTRVMTIMLAEEY